MHTCILLFQDSYAFIAHPLSSLPGMFGFEHEVVKGYFPHGWATRERLEAAEIPQLPPKHTYFPGTMKGPARRVFDEWYIRSIPVHVRICMKQQIIFDRYKNNCNKPFHFKQSAEVYGRDNVRILAKACLSFRKEILEVSNLDPWFTAFTLAGLCAAIFRSQMLCEDTIGLVPSNGYNKGIKFQSLMALKYLHWVAAEKRIHIQTAANTGGEVQIPGVGKVDGFSEETSMYLNTYRI